MRTGIARLDMAAERCGPAQFDRRHDAAFHAADMTVMGLAPGMTMAAKDIRHLQIGTHSSGSGRWYYLQRQTVEGTLRLRDRACCHMGVARRRREIVVPQ